MAIRIETASKDSCRAVIEGSMTIYEAALAKPVLLDALATAKKTEIDLSCLHEMDTAGLQLLILVKRESLKAGKVMYVVGHSQASLDVLDRYNLAAYFGEPVAISSRRKKNGRGAKSAGKR